MLRDVIASRVLKGCRIGRMCVGTKTEWTGNEMVDVPVFKETRFVLDFTDGLSLNVSKSVFLQANKTNK